MSILEIMTKNQCFSCLWSTVYHKLCNTSRISIRFNKLRPKKPLIHCQPKFVLHALAIQTQQGWVSYAVPCLTRYDCSKLNLGGPGLFSLTSVNWPAPSHCVCSGSNTRAYRIAHAKCLSTDHPCMQIMSFT